MTVSWSELPIGGISITIRITISLTFAKMATNPKSIFMFNNSFNLLSASAQDWWSALTSHAFVDWPNARDELTRFAMALILNSLKVNFLGPRKPAMFATSERVCLMSYIEAIFSNQAPIIQATWSATTCPADPTAITVFPKPVIVAATGIPASDIWDELVHAYLSQTGSTRATDYVKSYLADPVLMGKTREKFVNAQYSFLLGVAKKGDLTNQFSSRAIRALQSALGLENIELYKEDMSWCAQWTLMIYDDMMI